MFWQAMLRVVNLRAGGLAPLPGVDDVEIEAANPWAMLLRTFLPWVNAGQVPNYDQHEDDAVDSEADNGPGVGAEQDDVLTHEEDDLD